MEDDQITMDEVHYEANQIQTKEDGDLVLSIRGKVNFQCESEDEKGMEPNTSLHGQLEREIQGLIREKLEEESANIVKRVYEAFAEEKERQERKGEIRQTKQHVSFSVNVETEIVSTFGEGDFDKGEET